MLHRLILDPQTDPNSALTWTSLTLALTLIPSRTQPQSTILSGLTVTYMTDTGRDPDAGAHGALRSTLGSQNCVRTQALEVAADLSTAVVSTNNLQQALQYRGLNATDTQLLYSSGGAGGSQSGSAEQKYSTLVSLILAGPLRPCTQTVMHHCICVALMFVLKRSPWNTGLHRILKKPGSPGT